VMNPMVDLGMDFTKLHLVCNRAHLTSNMQQAHFPTSSFLDTAACLAPRDTDMFAWSIFVLNSLPDSTHPCIPGAHQLHANKGMTNTPDDRSFSGSSVSSFPHGDGTTETDPEAPSAWLFSPPALWGPSALGTAFSSLSVRPQGPSETIHKITKDYV